MRADLKFSAGYFLPKENSKVPHSQCDVVTGPVTIAPDEQARIISSMIEDHLRCSDINFLKSKVNVIFNHGILVLICGCSYDFEKSFTWSGLQTLEWRSRRCYYGFVPSSRQSNYYFLCCIENRESVNIFAEDSQTGPCRSETWNEA